MSVDKSKEVKMGDYSGSVLTWAMIKKDDVEIIFQREDRLIEEIPEFKRYENLRSTHLDE